MINRFYLEDISSGTITGDEFHHMKRVMRAKVGDAIEIIDGRGQLAHATITSMGKESAETKITDVQTFPPPEPAIYLAQGLPKQSRLELIVEKGCELGVAGFYIIPMDRSERSEIKSQNLKRLKTIAISALKQSGQLHLPTLTVTTLEELPLPFCYGDVSGEAPPLLTQKTNLICIGPESGFSERETAYLKSKATGVKLHKNILRTETAAIAALTLLTHAR